MSAGAVTVSDRSGDFELVSWRGQLYTQHATDAYKYAVQLDSSGYISETMDREWEAKQTLIRQLLELRSTLSQKQKGLQMLSESDWDHGQRPATYVSSRPLRDNGRRGSEGCTRNQLDSRYGRTDGGVQSGKQRCPVLYIGQPQNLTDHDR